MVSHVHFFLSLYICFKNACFLKIYCDKGWGCYSLLQTITAVRAWICFYEAHLVGDVIIRVLFCCLLFQVPNAISSTTFCSTLISPSSYNFNEKSWK